MSGKTEITTSESRAVKAMVPGYVDKILRMKPKQIENLWNVQRRKAGTDGSKR
jgi:ribosomal protein S17E